MALLTLSALLAPISASAESSFHGRFRAKGPNGLVTNEYAYWNYRLKDAIQSEDWEVTSGSLFCDEEGSGWTGVPDDKKVNVASTKGNHSAVFRMTTKRYDFTDVEVSFRLMNKGLHSTPATPVQAYDGVHIFMRYLDESNLYYASINRRDDVVVIKKKLEGGRSNGGTYIDISPSKYYKVPYGVWQKIRATIETRKDGVTIKLYADDKLLVTAVDTGRGGPPIREAGKVGLRVDNAEAKFSDFTVTPLAPVAPAASK